MHKLRSLSKRVALDYLAHRFDELAYEEPRKSIDAFLGIILMEMIDNDREIEIEFPKNIVELRCLKERLIIETLVLEERNF